MDCGEKTVMKRVLMKTVLNAITRQVNAKHVNPVTMVLSATIHVPKIA